MIPRRLQHRDRLDQRYRGSISSQFVQPKEDVSSRYTHKLNLNLIGIANISGLVLYQIDLMHRLSVIRCRSVVIAIDQGMIRVELMTHDVAANVSSCQILRTYAREVSTTI